MSDAIPHATVITQGDTELAPVHHCNAGMYSEYSHNMLMEKNMHAIFYPTLPWQWGPIGN